MKKRETMKEATVIQHYRFDYKERDFIEDPRGDFVARLDHEKAVANIIAQSDKESFSIPCPHPVARCKGFDGVIRADVIYPEIEQIAKLSSLFVDADEHKKIIGYLNDQLNSGHSGITRYELFRFGPDKYRMMPYSKGEWIKYNDHKGIIDKLYQNFHLQKVHFSDILTYGIVTSGPNNWYLDQMSHEDYDESEAEFASYEDHQSTMLYLESELIR